MMKRCAIKSITRDKEYDITKGTPKSEILYMSVNPNGEAEVLKVYYKPRPRLKKVIVDLNFSELAIKGRQSQGNLFSHYGIHKIVLKERGTSTLSGQNIWFDEDVRRLNSDSRGQLLGEFKGDDKILVWTAKNQYYITNFDISQHFPDETVRVEKFNPESTFSVCYYDGSQNYYYMKRFKPEVSDKMQLFLDEESKASFVAITDRDDAILRVTFKGAHSTRPAEEISVEEFVGVKSYRAKGKRISNYEIDTLTFIEPEIVQKENPSEEELQDEPFDAEAFEQIGSDALPATATKHAEEESEVDVVDVVVDPEQLNLF
jgi:topoisomerase-4 subunit A